MIGSVVSIVVAPPEEIGARVPKTLTRSGAPRSVMISLMIFERSAIVPNSTPFISVISTLDRE